MIVLSAVIHLPKKAILWFSIIVILGHNLLDTVHFKGNEIWAILHEFHVFPISKDYLFVVAYPIFPWIAVM